MGHLRDDIGRSRSNHENISLLGQGHMLHLKLKVPVKGVNQALLSGKGFKGRWGDEICCILCHDDPHIGVLLHQHAGQVCDLVGCDTAAHTQHYGFSF